jgi:hypothetical protein
MLKLVDEDQTHPDETIHSPAAAAKLLAGIRAADPVTALDELSGWLDTIKGPGQDEKIRSEVLSMIQEAGAAPLSALLAQFLSRPAGAGKQATREPSWRTLTDYLKALTGALYASARLLLKEAATNLSLQLAAAAGAARGLHACRMLAKACLVRYLSVPPKLLRLAYAMHDAAEKAGCAALPVRLHAVQKTATSVTQELLRLLMLQSSAPQMMAPEQIEVADRVFEQVGGDFTLRPRGVTDNPFCVDLASDRPPHRAVEALPGSGSELRYFGAGTGFLALERLYKQLATTRTADIKALGKDIALHTQLSTIQHLLAFWGPASPYSPPARSEASGELRVIHGHAQICQHLSELRSATTELALEQSGNVPQAPVTWILNSNGGDELGAEIPQRSGDWAQCGDVIGVSMNGMEECWLGMIRSVHAEWDGRLYANIAILSRDPQAVQIRTLIAEGESVVYSEKSAREFAFERMQAIILSDGSSEGSQKPNFLLPAKGWKEERLYEATIGQSVRQLRGVQLLRRGEDYVRATFEWVAQA